MRRRLSLGLLRVTAVRAGIPYPAALDGAAVVQERISDLNREALVLGNGDLNALLWDRGDALCLRVTKNDLWDARIDTSKDPTLLTMDISNRTWSGGTGRPPSWHDHPYPQPRCAAVVTIGDAPAAARWTCVRSAAQNDWALKDGLGVMSVAGAREASAGYALPSPSVGASALILRLSGTPNARYFVNVTDGAGQDLVRSGWVDTPAAEKDVVFPLPAARPAARLELYVMSRDGQRAENRFRTIVLESGEGTTSLPLGAATTEARLDLRRAVATVNDTSVRALADRNVFLIETAGEVALEEIKAPQLPPAALGEIDGVKWLHMAMPGDVDYRGMEYAVAVAARGDRKAVSLVTSFDTTGNVRETAIRLARAAADSETAALVTAHEAEWAKFWSASGMELADRFFQDAWYRNLYYMRCFCRTGTTMPITLYAGLANDNPGWHGSPTLDYNIEQVFWPMFVCNQVDLMEPYVRYIEGFAPRARWLAKQTYGLDGLFLPVNIFGPEFLVAPADSKSVNARQIAYVPWTYGLGLTGWGLQNLWLRYLYQPDRAFLESVYPLLRDGAEFYANVIGQCRDDDGDGKVEIGPSYNPEHGPFGSFNNPVDLAYFRFLLDAAARAAETLARDETLVRRWRTARGLVPDYETAPRDDGPIVADWRGAAAEAVPVHNVTSPTVPVFPAEQVTWFSPPEEKALFERTLRRIRHNGNNAHIMANVARARLSMPEAYTETRAHFAKIVTPNGLYASWPGHGYYLAESWAFAGLTAELLLQSVGDPSTGSAGSPQAGSGLGTIRVFPAWPRDKDARFIGLRAQGGFLVSAEQKDGKVLRVEVRSTAGGQLRLLNPWTGKLEERKTRAGETLEISP